MNNDLISRKAVLSALENVFEEYKMSFGKRYGGLAEAVPKAIESIPAAHDMDTGSVEQNFYFTFGSSKQYPYQNGYIIVIADSLEMAIAKFREKYPDVNNNTINCSFYYTEEEWNRIALGRSRDGVAKPKEILR